MQNLKRIALNVDLNGDEFSLTPLIRVSASLEEEEELKIVLPS